MLKKLRESVLSSMQFGAFCYNFRSEIDAYNRSKVILFGVPYDGTVSYQSGTKKGPNAILEASVNMEPYDDELGNIFKIGIFTVGNLNIEEFYTNEKKVVDEVFACSKIMINDNKFLVTLGGEHSISYGAIKAYKNKYKKLSVLQLDAHLDLLKEFGGSKYNHASVMRRVVEDFGCGVTSFGVRVTTQEELEFVKKNKKSVSVFYARDIYDNNIWHDEALRTLEENVYITLDVDGLDISIMPATGTPVPGGIGWYQTIDFLRKVYKEKNVVGFDIVELKPNVGNEAPNFLAANLVYKNIGFYRKYSRK